MYNTDMDKDVVHVKIYTQYYKNEEKTVAKTFGVEYPVRVKEFIDLLDADNEYIEVRAQREREYLENRKHNSGLCEGGSN